MSGTRLVTAVLALIAVLAALTLAAGPAAAATPRAQRAVPQGFVGTVADGPVFPDTDNHINLGRQLDVMVASGVESVRVVFDWAQAQPYSSWSDVPAAEARQFVDEDGIPTRFAAPDQIVGLAAQRGLTVLPIVIDAPPWDAAPKQSAVEANPRSVYWYGQFAKELAARYGPHGSFWATHSPKVPITMWQIWNEPDLTMFWPAQPFARSYVTMLAAARRAIRSADPKAKILLGGLTNYSWNDLAQIYKVKGAASLFDVVAIHPYTKTPSGVIKILGLVRSVMNAHGDGQKPLLADEVSWPSSRGSANDHSGFSFSTTEAQQASDLSQVLPLLAANRIRLRLAGFYYYDWASVEMATGPSFSYAGLFRYVNGRFVAKPAFAAFKRAALALEHCRAKQRATGCRNG
ncbi:MAG: hypothetical protein JO168_06775 [Solirubrobacterales bacterium]|nr:hypothetical protein [Solirubrobacterales bacterium]MBV9714937.1 hypothetical protein [Solirubrobacterales bacterium]